MQKTIGGDRLGSGKKMKANMHGFERSTHDMGYIFRTTMASGTLVPFLKEIALPGDTFDIDLNCDVKTHPTVGPLFGSYKVQIDIFQAPIRLYNSYLHNNRLSIGMNMAQIKLPMLKVKPIWSYENTPADIDNYNINPSCLLSYLGIRGAGTYNNSDYIEVYREFNALTLLSYWDIYKNYYANKQEEIGAVIHTPVIEVSAGITSIIIFNGNDETLMPYPTLTTPGIQLSAGISIIKVTLTAAGQFEPADVNINVGTPTSPMWVGLGANVTFHSNPAPDEWWYTWTGDLNEGINYQLQSTVNPVARPIEITYFPLSDIDLMRDAILAQAGNTVFDVSSQLLDPYKLLFEEEGTSPDFILSMQYTQEGLGLKTYQSDLLNNWISTEWIDGTGGISDVTAIDTTSGSFNIDTLNLSKKVYDMLNRIAISGGTYDDWLDVQYDHNRFTRAETPIYHGGLSKELVFQEVVSNTATQEEPLGSLAGKGVMSNKHKGGKVTIRVDEPSYIIGIVSITPRLDYSQGNDWDTHLETMNDLHVPSLDEIGYQELITEQMAWWDTEYAPGVDWVTKSAGKQPAWINYMTNINKVRGNFAIKDNEMFMTLNRNYTADLETPEAINIKDLTTYVDPRIYNQIFADTSLDSQNFWTQIGVDMMVRRKMSAKIMPNL